MNGQHAVRKCVSNTLLIAIFAFAIGVAAAQGPGKGGGANSAASQSSAAPAGQSPAPGAAAAAASGAGSGGASLQGFSYSRASWEEIHAMPAPSSFQLSDDDIGHFFWDDLAGHSFRKDVVVFCYSLKKNPSAADPLVLEPTRILPEETEPGKQQGLKPYSRELCANQVHSAHKAVSLIMGRYLVFRIDMNEDEIPPDMWKRIETLNINVTNQAGSSFNSQRGPTLNPATVRPSMALTAGWKYPCPGKTAQLDQYKLAGLPLRYAFCPDSGNEDMKKKLKHVYYLVWPGPLLGDTVASVSINVIYTPVAAALPLKPNTFYPAGTIVSADNETGHYYLAVNGGVSSETPPHFAQAVTEVETFHEEGSTGLRWKDAGEIPSKSPGNWKENTAYDKNAWVSFGGQCYQAAASGKSGSKNDSKDEFSPNPDYLDTVDNDGTMPWIYMGPCLLSPTPQAWAPSTAYAKGTVVVPPGQKDSTGGHYYSAESDGVSSANAPAFPVDGTDVSESDGIYYMDAGTTPPTTGALRIWEPHTLYRVNDVVLDARTGHYYTVVQGGISGPTPRRVKTDSAAAATEFFVPNPKTEPAQATDGTVQWQDLGSTLPAGTLVGNQPSDLTLNVLNLSLPQTHVLSYFNLASGVVVSSIKPPSINSVTANSTSGCLPGVNSCTIYTSSKGGRLIDPVLGITVYAIKPLDAERPFRWTDTVPAPTLDISLSSPTSNFHIGFASEFLVRNLQVVYGVSAVEESRLAGTITYEPGNKSMPGPGTQATALYTSKKFNYGGFVGFTFNITGFIQSLIP